MNTVRARDEGHPGDRAREYRAVFAAGAVGGALRRGARLDGNGNLPHALDFRELYATVLERWWGVASSGPLRGRFTPLEVVRA